MKKTYLKESAYLVKEGHIVEARYMTAMEKYFKISCSESS